MTQRRADECFGTTLTSSLPGCTSTSRDATPDPIDIDSPASHRDGARLGDYVLQRWLGAGGVGEVFAARHVETGEVVALKFLRTTSAIRLYRFKREFRTLAALAHPNLVRLYELTVPESGAAFFTMELLSGQSFVDWVRESKRPGELPELERLLAAFRQLVEGVHELHAHGYVHRDLKPANALVCEDGRVVILDLGLVAEVADSDRNITREHQVVGTPNFMAPEQAAGRPIQPAVDLYALGVMLYMSLTGVLPRRGSESQLLADKQGGATPDPGNEVADCPDWLRSLCARLLARDPEARPSIRELLDRLRARRSSELAGPELFVGRQLELAELHTALSSVTAARAPVLVAIRGPSGYGKSSLVRHFRGQLPAEGVLFFQGRCGQNETLPYKGLDAVVDHLSAHLRRLSAAELDSLRPQSISALAQMFPVLGEIWPAKEDPIGYALDEVRRFGALALRELLGALASKYALVVHIDDWQWSDRDSLELLSSLLRAPAPALLLVLTGRSEMDDAFLGDLARVTPPRTIELEALSSTEAKHLARELLLRAKGVDHQLASGAETLAFRSRGNPFFIRQTVLGGYSSASDDPDIDHLVASRLAGLDGAARELLDTVAVFGAPMPLTLCEHASEATIAALCEQGLLMRGEAGVETAHDRVREVALAELGELRRRTLHGRLGQRLRAELDDHTIGEQLFAAVNHLDASVADIEALDRDARLDLARLNQRAGELALHSTAWTTAQRYYALARELVAPWLDDARRGLGEHRLCVDSLFGWCQVALFLELDGADAVLAELMSWSLSTADYCRIAEWCCHFDMLTARFHDCVSVGLRALNRLGHAVPERPSLVGALVSFWRGWQAVWNTGLDGIVALPEPSDPQLVAALDIAAMTCASAGFVGPKQQLATMGNYCRMVARHGLHDWSLFALSGLAMAALAIGKQDKARVVLELTTRLAESRSSSAAAACITNTLLLLVTATMFPIRECLARGEAAYLRAREIGHPLLIEPLALVYLPSLILAGNHLAKTISWSADMRASCRQFTFAHTREDFDEFDGCMSAMVEGPASLDITRELGSNLTASDRSIVLALRLLAAVLLGEREGAWKVVEEIDRDFPADVELLWPAALYRTLAVVPLTDRWRSAGAFERRRLGRRLRRWRKVVRRWARRCPANYQPMLDLIEAEHARVLARHALAIDAYERARSGAGANQMHWLTGLASERLAAHFTEQRQSLLAKGALTTAREAYDAFGATGVVRRIDDLIGQCVNER